MREVSQIKGTNQQEAKGAIVDTKKVILSNLLL